MIIVDPRVEILDSLAGEDILRKIELCGRVCYKSEEKMSPDSAKKFVAGIIKSGHESVLEHVSFSVRFTCDRGVSHEIVRHRIASYSQESTRYCNYGHAGEITVICPSSLTDLTSESYGLWHRSCREAEQIYLRMIWIGRSPQVARSVLPNSLKTELIMTANLREWRHFLKLRTAINAHPDMRVVANALLKEVHQLVPVIFDDIAEVDYERT